MVDVEYNYYNKKIHVKRIELIPEYRKKAVKRISDNRLRHTERICTDGETIWAASKYRICKFDALTNSYLDSKTISYVDFVRTLLFDGEYLWMGCQKVSDIILYKFSPNTLDLLDTVTIEDSYIKKMIFDGEHIWVALWHRPTGDTKLTGYHYRYPRYQYLVRHAVFSGRYDDLQLVANGNYLYLGIREYGTSNYSIHKISRSNLLVIESLELQGRVYDMCFINREIMTYSINDSTDNKNKIFNYDWLEGSGYLVLDELQHPASYFCNDGSYIWWLSGKSLEGIRTYMSKSTPISTGNIRSNIVFDGTHLWYYSLYDFALVKIPVFPQHIILTYSIPL